VGCDQGIRHSSLIGDELRPQAYLRTPPDLLQKANALFECYKVLPDPAHDETKAQKRRSFRQAGIVTRNPIWTYYLWDNAWAHGCIDVGDGCRRAIIFAREGFLRQRRHNRSGRPIFAQLGK
jgi:hypothetical protein